MEKKKHIRKIRRKTIAAFILLFCIINGAIHFGIKNQIDEEKLKASYTAESTVRRIEAQLNKYLSKSELLKRIIESGCTLSNEQFDQLSKYMMEEEGVIEAIELAPDGVVDKIYPLAGNQEAMGLDMLTDAERHESALLARDSGEYTIAGPFNLVQGGTGALLFDPIYLADDSGQKNFWGFSILVVNWERFIAEVELDKLEEASYHYQVWKESPSTGRKITIAQCEKPTLSDALEVACEVPNDIWYFEICPKEGWYSKTQLLLNTLLGALLAVLISLVYWQFSVRQYKDACYAEEIRKSAEEAKAANNAKTGFLSRMSHDIRTPLNGIIGLLKIDEKHPDDRERVDQNRTKMMVAANHLLALINDVLQMSKLESGEMILAHEVVDLTALSKDIRTMMEQRAADAGVTMEYAGNTEFTSVYGSPLHIRQVFLNVYGNGIKYNKVGGKVRTYVEKLGEDEKTVTYRWRISDTGVGMSQEFLKHVFEPFAQEHSDARSVYNGTGLGMSIVKTLIDKMNGTIEVESTEGEGSTFIITIPFEVAEKEKSEETILAEDSWSIHGLHLLLAEDNELNAEIAQLLLQDEGARITLVKDGKKAVEAFAESEPGTYDAILMDIMMPKMDGITATKKIRALNREDAGEIPIIAMTANAFDEDARKCIAAGMNAHLSKPLQMEKVVATIAKFCEKK